MSGALLIMNKLFILLLLFATTGNCQTSPASGVYAELKLAFNKSTNQVTGFYENGTGYDETTGQPRFSCIFYIEGKLAGNKATINTYFPLNKDVITGVLIVENKAVKIQLPEEHGGCWNVEHFADKEPAAFALDQAMLWIQIRYAVAGKAYFYSDQQEAAKRNAYILKGDVVYIEKMNNGWVYCSYSGKTTTKGWMRESDLNKLR